MQLKYYPEGGRKNSNLCLSLMFDLSALFSNTIDVSYEAVGRHRNNLTDTY